MNVVEDGKKDADLSRFLHLGRARRRTFAFEVRKLRESDQF